MNQNRFKLVLTGVLIVFGCARWLNGPNENHIDMYKRAYEHVQSSEATRDFLENVEGIDKPFQIEVSDTVVFLELTSFFDHFRDKSENSDGAVLDSLMARDDSARFSKYQVKELGKIGANNSSLILFFSEPRNNILIAELFYNYSDEDCYDRIATLNKGLMFMIIFGDDGKIQRSVTTVVEYN